MRSFLYREPRFKTNVSMDLILEDRVYLGNCFSISESGLRGNFSSVVSPPAQGILTLYYLDTSCQIPALVETLRGDEARVKFLIDSPREQQLLRTFLGRLPGSPQGSR
jgi:hypothetical protein